MTDDDADVVFALRDRRRTVRRAAAIVVAGGAVVHRFVAVVAVVSAVAIGACSSSSNHAATTTAPGATSATSAPRHFDVVLDDGGVTVPNGRFPAGSYRVSFSDRRSHPSGVAVLRFIVSGGPVGISLGEVPAGSTVDKVLYANEGVEVAIDGTRRDLPWHGSFSIETTPQYPTPVT